MDFSYFVSTAHTAYHLITQDIAVSPVVPNCIIEGNLFLFLISFTSEGKKSS